ncbi:hypothetical protein DICVIV_01354 [Dictyocaulus viviparus]|uniref:N-acetyltransferase ESCO zinc-finger domain-containing protein n=1 Tax=Dictyocaulus viviparus TaxID=29172 RepID=A0A0D8Y6L4_DICVI|nr:hypothetical protein DICVIV_01354 [Dictyocaulus viviparus]
MEKQSRVTDFFAPSSDRKLKSVCAKTALFDVELKPLVRKKVRLSGGGSTDGQTILDAGQKNIGGVYCKQCDMMYSRDNATDLKMHEKHHNRYVNIKEVQVSSSMMNSWLRNQCHYQCQHGYVFRILPDSQSSLKSKVQQVIKDFVDTSVGFCVDLSIWGWDKRRTVWASLFNQKSMSLPMPTWLRISDSSGFAILLEIKKCSKSSSLADLKDFVDTSVGFCVDLSIWGWDKRRTVWASLFNQGSSYYIAGVVITEPLMSAQCSSTGKLIAGGDPLIGVNRIWTHPVFRKRGIASEILDIIRKWYFTGITVLRHRVAFSDPSDDGRRFAEKYIRRHANTENSLLVYTVTK